MYRHSLAPYLFATYCVPAAASEQPNKLPQCKDNIAKKKLAAIIKNLIGEASAQQICLEWFDLVMAQPKEGLTYWHYAEATQAA